MSTKFCNIFLILLYLMVISSGLFSLAFQNSFKISQMFSTSTTSNSFILAELICSSLLIFNIIGFDSFSNLKKKNTKCISKKVKLILGSKYSQGWPNCNGGQEVMTSRKKILIYRQNIHILIKFEFYPLKSFDPQENFLGAIRE